MTVSRDRLRIADVTRGNLVRDVSVQGRVIAAVRPTLYAPASGTITLLVDAGEQVSEGSILAQIDSPELTNVLRQGQSSLEQLTMDVERQKIESRQAALEKRKTADLAEVALVAAKREKRRADESHSRGIISLIDFEKSGDDLSNAQLAFDHAIADSDLYIERLTFEHRAREFELKSQQLLVTDLQRQVSALRIRSPGNGIVGDLLVDQKAAVSKDTPVMSVVDLSKFEIEAQIPESYADDLEIGMAAEITIGATRYPGQLVAVSPEIVANQVSSRIRFSNDMPTNIRQNQRLTTRILIEEHPNVLMVQRGQFLDSGGGRVAYVVGDDGIAVRRKIDVGARSLGAVQVMAGLNQGDSIVISGIDIFQGAETVLITD